jgi:type II secretory pathway component PulK
MRHQTGKTGADVRRGFVLVAVLVVVVLLSLAAYQFSDAMLAEFRLADSYQRTYQVKALADSGINYTAVLLSNNDAFTSTLGSNPWDNAQVFQAVAVNPQDAATARGRFTIIATVGPDDITTAVQPFRFGVTDESGKINLNALMQIDPSGQIAKTMLMQLPNMTDEISDAILDWIDSDDDQRPNGAENAYYQTLSPPYYCKNGPLDSIEELLFVKGVTPRLLFGNDRNRNGTLEPDEDDGSGTIDLGWAAYLTVYSREQNVDSQGNPRIYVNGQDLNQLQQDLSAALGDTLANYIIAYRLYGPATTTMSTTPTTGSSGTSNSPSPSGGSQGSRGGSSGVGSTGGGASLASSPDGKLLASAGGQPPASPGAAAPSGPGSRSPIPSGSINTKGGKPKSIGSIFELVNSSVDIPSSTPNGQPTRYASPLSDPASIKQYLPQLLDELTTSKKPETPARININTAPAAVLAGLPGLAATDVQTIISTRPNPSSTDPPDPIFQTTTWLITEANLSPTTVQALDKYITARTQVYRVQAIGFFEKGGPTARIEAVIDTNMGYPRVLYRRDLSELGRGYDATVLGMGGN